MKKQKLSRRAVILIAVDALILLGVIILAVVTLSRDDNKQEKPKDGIVSQTAKTGDEQPDPEIKDPADKEDPTGEPVADEGETKDPAVSGGGEDDNPKDPGTEGEDKQGGTADDGKSDETGDPAEEEPGTEEKPGDEDTPADDNKGSDDPGNEVTVRTASDPYEGLDGLSGKLAEWCFERKKDHSPSGTYEPFNISKYDAYYLNPNVKEGDKVIYFSFDCGYENGYTPKILDTLKKHGVKATFFVTQQFLDSDADLAKRMKEEGHIVGNHTVHHPSLPEKTAEEVVKEVRGVEESFKEKTGYELDKFIRPPMGHYSEKVLKELQNMGYITIFWSIAYGDYDIDNQPGKQYVIDHFRQYHHNGAITLTHTVSESNAKALDQVLTDLEAEGYRFGSLDELRH